MRIRIQFWKRTPTEDALTSSTPMASSEFSFGNITPRPNPAEPFARSFARESEVLPASDDNFLLRGVQRGDEAAIAQLFDRYSKLVYSVALRVLRDPSAAEDVLHETFLNLWSQSESYNDATTSLGGWLAVSARNRSLDTLRRKKTDAKVEEFQLPAAVRLAEEADRTATLERTRAALLRLPAEQRKALDMAYFDGLTHTEIAELTSEPAATVKTRIRTGFLQLRKAMQL
ncbi:RNA polymerase sigma factor [Terriglobus roseus]|uniref:RNA polymerase sigma-70 factor, ECF subfamily n=1 Tax=Terriglobus roseus TaxID=392734 RepID=A0A1G7IRC5_9BACT|nr:sigma-70 family RNA polymerase sigma factor [Terriglobus roseus]SDF15136.1 RNA polymerase sigma-70 factor, ECF subfamily [Terriglobus roseus]